ncbi:thiol reductant ABC exporter subunit CydD [Lederbergia citrea]|uniref:Thiol reductant ABC exporter subunit CydD n=1 Tax=Lederbergia citrea TaxID=2833581 RepID=A0A942Z721_9BACI|nr:thiol reductant ABC exporter subunit CydD [Lederbergia citrea]MBS4205880.1 thiol reductant ABC exporter subunit CydD [Lederbergia citrea]MBS4224671.1 thiol reductant ABC exporter subunit CydD [Lederbergia citrea]
MDKHLFHYKGSKRVMAFVGLLTLGQVAAIIYQALYLSKAITQMFQGAVWSAILPSFFTFLAAYALRHLLQWGKERLAYKFADRTALSFQELLIRKVFDLGPRSIGKHGSGNLITLALEGIPQFKTYLELFIPRFMSMGIIPFVLFLYIFAIDRISGIILAVVMPILIAFLILLGFAAQKQMDAQLDTYKLLSRHFVDSLRGLVTLKYLGRSKSHQKAIEIVSNKYRIATNRTLRVAFLSTFSLDFFTSLSVAVIAVELGLRLINGHIGLEAALAILILAPKYFLPVRELGNDYHATMDGKEAGEQIRELLAEKTSDQTDFSPTLAQWTESSRLSFEHVSKRSDEERTILQRIKFEASGYQKIGIVGASGAGKSTLIDLLSGFTQPTAGKILVNGNDLEHLSIPAWQEQLTYIPQHPYIFSGTVAENISFYEPNAGRADIERAAGITGLNELISRFPNGFDEKIGQGGRALSGGEEQRIALARSLLQNRSILLFDEPTAHLDIETEQEIKEMILPILENKLVFFATHRLHWMKNMDLILVLEAGQIVEMGTHEQLIGKSGAYDQLIQAHRRGMKE